MTPETGPLSLYREPLTLALDFYQITSAYAFWKAGLHKRQTIYNMFFRSLPFKGGYAVAAGLQYVKDWIVNFEFKSSDLAYLSEQKGNDGRPLFEQEFLNWLYAFRFRCDLYAVPEGTVVFPNEPLVRVEGTIVENLLIETFCLTAINSQTLFATKAARVCDVAGNDPVLEFGLRRAQGADGGIAASRAAFIGGCVATSNVEAGRLYGIPVKGTHPHGLVMFSPTEIEAFRMYAEAMPNNVVFLVDTYNTLQGVKHAIETTQQLKTKLVGVRLDSGDLAYLSIEARKLLDAAGLTDAKIFASNDLDEHVISTLKQQGAKIDVWGVGTKLVTAYDQPALGGVYKLGAVMDEKYNWHPKVKLSEQAAKTTNPGALAAFRFLNEEGFYAADMIYEERFVGTRQNHNPDEVHDYVMVDPLDPTRRRRFSRQDSCYHKLLKHIIHQGKSISDSPPLTEIRDFAKREIARLHPSIRRLANPHEYPVGLHKPFYDFKTNLILEQRGH